MTFNKKTWADDADGGTPITAAEMNRIEQGVSDNDTAIAGKADAAGLARVATTGAYVDLSGRPTLAPIATSGNYVDLTGKPTLAPVATSGAYTDITGKPTLAPVATSGSYTDLTSKPAFALVATSGNYIDLTNRPTISTVGTTGAYNDLTGKPTLATVATTGAYNDLSGKPVIPSVVSGNGVTVTNSGGIYTVTATATSNLGSTTTADFGAVALDSFTGPDDDTKLTNALAAVSADTYKRTILLTNRKYTFTTANRTAFNGMRIQGPAGYSNADKGSIYEASEINLSMSGPWFNNNTVDVFDVSLTALSFKGSSTATVLGQSGGGSWWRLHMRDISSSGLLSVLGTVATKLLMTGAHFDGFWEINNCYSTAFHLGGSDNRLWSNGGFLDSGTAFNSTAGLAHMWFDDCANTTVGPVYITAEGPWTGIKIDGSLQNGGPISFYGMEIEGRNAGAPSNGSVVRMNGGIARFRDCDFHFGMSNPSAQGRTPADAGVVHHAGGQLVIAGAQYDKATSVAFTVPFVYTAATAATDKCIVKEVQVGGDGGSWTTLPIVALKSGNTDNRITDATVTLATV
jgi:hypothetical protein